MVLDKFLGFAGIALAVGIGCKGEAGSTQTLDEAAKVASADDPNRAKEALARGRAAASRKDLVGARVAFEEAVAAAPRDAAALSELGWTLFKLDELDAAQKTTQQAIDAADGAAQAKLKAASLYNLGRIHEARGQTAQAKEAYKSSIELRPHKGVSARLAGLDSSVTSSSPIAPELSVAEGPFSTLEKYCADQQAAGDWACSLDQSGLTRGPSSLAQPAAPWSAVRVFSLQESSEFPGPSGPAVSCMLGIQIADAWYVTNFAECASGGTMDTGASTSSLELQPGPAGQPPMLVLRYRTHADEAWAERLMICGIGPSNRPSCTPGIPTAMKGKPKIKVTLDPSGVLVVGADTSDYDHLAPGEVPNWKGTHRLAFP
jgi:hypothetical protein